MLSRFEHGANHPADEHDFPMLEAARALVQRQRTTLPLLVEFTGLPKAGKTTVISRVKRGLDQLGFKVLVVNEAATTRVDRSLRSDLFAFNTKCMMINIEEVIQGMNGGHSFDVIIYDRGLFDSMIWIDFLRRIGLASSRNAQPLQEFCRNPIWFDEISRIYWLDADWDTYQQRFQKDSPFPDEPRLNKKYFEVLRRCYQDRYESRHSSETVERDIVRFDCSIPPATHARDALETSWKATHRIACEVIGDVLELLAKKGDEQIAVIPDEEYASTLEKPLDNGELARFIQSVFGRTADGAVVSGQIHKAAFGTPVRWVDRAAAEQDPSLLQLIACAYITQDQKYLVLTRSSAEERELLRNKRTLVVGGHIDRIDMKSRWGGSSEVENCLLREMKEELSHIDMPIIKPRFALRMGDSTMGRKHLALIHEVETYSKNIETVQVPGAGDFCNRPTFESVEWLREHVDSFDPWSRVIISRL